MILAGLLVRIAVVVAALVTVVAVLLVGRDRLERLAEDAPARARSIGPHVALLVGVLVVNAVARRYEQEVSGIIGWYVTGHIYQVEGTLVADLQSLASPPLTAYFSFVYVYGYVFLLVFPLVAYFALDDQTTLRRTIDAYAINYVVGLGCYLLFIAYGPRNFMPELVDSLLYTSWPESQLLTSRVNTSRNVFPSLHTSLSVTVAAFAYRTRATYRGWFYLAVPLAASVAASTVYLAIHWAVDVVAGIALAAFSVAVATRPGQGSMASRWTGGDAWVTGLRRKLRR